MLENQPAKMQSNNNNNNKLDLYSGKIINYSKALYNVSVYKNRRI